MTRERKIVVACGIIVACGAGGARVRAPQEGQARSRVAGRCSPSGIRSGGVCPKVKIPPVNASSDRGCKSDADCGSESARCIKNPAYVPDLDRPDRRAHRGNWLGAAPSPPQPTICVDDGCHRDEDCGKGYGCECGSGEGADRHQCILLDACTADADCKAGSRCECDRRGPNYCLPANCDSDAECGGRECASSPLGGRYCRTSNDRCVRDSDCGPSNDYRKRCGYDLTTASWRCYDIPLPPPG